MFRKTIVLSLVSLGFTFSIGKSCFADTAGDLQQVDSYIKAGQFSQAEQLCASIAQSNPGSDYALKSQGKLAVVYIMTNKVTDANTLVDGMINSFRNNTELPAILYGIMERYKLVREFQKAQNLSQRICQEFPSSEQAQRIQLDAGKERVFRLIADGEFQQAEKAANNMASVAGSNPAMPATLFKIAKEFKECERYDETERIYQRLAQSYPNSEFAAKGRMGVDKLRIWNLIKTGDVTGAQTALAKLVSEYSGNDDLPHTVHGIALKFEETGFYQQAKALYEKIEHDYADDPIAEKIAVNLKRCDIRAMVGTSSFGEVSQQIDMLRQSFPGSSHAISAIGEEYYKRAVKLESQGLDEQAKALFQNAANVCDVVINTLPPSSAIPDACNYAGICYEKLGQYDKANQCYQKVIDGYPGYRLRWNMMFLSGRNYEQMKSVGVIPAAQADAQIKAIYERLLAEYPECRAAKYAKRWLGR